jgi:hypothetical protein
VPEGGYHRGQNIPALTGSFGGWQSQSDSSIRAGRNHRSVEIVSPILRGAAGLGEVVAALSWLRGLGARVNGSCGMHVHVGWKSYDTASGFHSMKALSNLVCFAAQHEDAMYAQTGSWQRAHDVNINRYCRGVSGTHQALAAALRKLGETQKIAARARELSRNIDLRFRVLNLDGLFGAIAGNTGSKPTAEFRAFAGTLNAHKAVGHICFCLGLAEMAIERKYAPVWEPRELKSENNRYRRGGEGESAVYRSLRRMKWVASNAPREYGWIDPVAGPLSNSLGVRIAATQRETIVNKMLDMARKYDRAGRVARGLPAADPPAVLRQTPRPSECVWNPVSMVWEARTADARAVIGPSFVS